VTLAETGVWKTGAIEGYSARFGENFSSTGLEDTILQILDLSYAGPLITLSASPSTAVREKGTPVASVTLTANTTRRTSDISEVIFYRAGAPIFTDSAPNPLGSSIAHTSVASFSDNMSFYASVSDGTTTVNSNTVTYSFVYPYYYGAGVPGLTSAQVGALAKNVVASTASMNMNFTTANGNVYYFAYPASYGALTSILDENGFETFADWTLRTEAITGLDGTAQTYSIYVFDNPVVAGTTNFTFRR
jgi:hypothetical protein